MTKISNKMFEYKAHYVTENAENYTVKASECILFTLCKYCGGVVSGRLIFEGCVGLYGINKIHVKVVLETLK
jgi:hypothetical protein